ncbi:hypothetical protein [Solicola gregarius]|uniref:Uncharacterized protein n=1 Tax=Solicola gregarius TaxID=2908642 RepID=A0AA46TLQ2_9ACTN|nr:hypothetical protein [Solicola gregarius]UYM07385.1 hypothetical protein L0C25_10050 [Solicola gregarius]
MAGHTVHLGSHELHWQGHQERHNVSDVMITCVVIGLAFTAFSIVMMRTGTYDSMPWHTLAVAIGIPSALMASFVCLRRGWEDTH